MAGRCNINASYVYRFAPLNVDVTKGKRSVASELRTQSENMYPELFIMPDVVIAALRSDRSRHDAKICPEKTSKDRGPFLDLR